MPRISHTRSPWMTTVAASAALSLATAAYAQQPPPETPPPTSPPAQAAPAGQPAAGADQQLAKQHLTAARNALNDVTQLPAASQLAGENRTRVQQLITSFNELITTGTNWRQSYAKVEANLDALLAAEPPAPVAATPPPSGTPGAVGTSGTSAAPGIDPAIRAKLVEFRQHLEKFESVVGGTPSPDSAAPGAEPAAAAGDPPTPAAPPAPDRPDSPRPDPDAPAAEPAMSEELLQHVEAVEVILGAQAAAQARATAAAGGAVTTAPTPSGSTRTTITNPEVTLTRQQLDEIKTHLSEIRRLLERK